MSLTCLFFINFLWSRFYSSSLPYYNFVLERESLIKIEAHSDAPYTRQFLILMHLAAWTNSCFNLNSSEQNQGHLINRLPLITLESPSNPEDNLSPLLWRNIPWARFQTSEINASSRQLLCFREIEVLHLKIPVILLRRKKAACLEWGAPLPSPRGRCGEILMRSSHIRAIIYLWKD